MASQPTRPTEAFERECLPWLADVRAFALALTRRPADADDLAQETFLKALRAFSTFQPGSNAKAWLFTVARRLHIDRHRRAQVRPQPLAEQPLEESGLDPAGGAGPGEASTPPGGWSRFTPEQVRAAIEAVPEPFRMAVVLRDLHGLAYDEVAEVLDVAPGTVMSRLHRGRECVRRHLVSLLDTGR